MILFAAMASTLRQWVRVFRPVLVPNVGHLALLAAGAMTAMGVEAISVADADFVLPQLKFVPVALAAMMLAAVIHYRRLVPLAYPMLIVIGVMLIVLLIPGVPHSFVPVRNGARRWFNLQFMMFQPSELAKVAYVLALAAYLRFRSNYRTFRGLLAPALLTFVPMGLILKEPDLGTSLVFLPVLFAMLTAAGARLKHLLAVILVGLVLMPAMYPLLEPHQKDRIMAMAMQVRGDPRYRSSIGFQGYKAMTLVGAGGVSGQGEAQAKVLVDFNALPEPQNDMIFAVICVRWGLIGGLTVFGLNLLFIASGLAAAGMTKDPFARLIAVGVVTIVFTQMLVNIGMTVGVLPITGMTLPFISYGGSSLVANYLLVGLLLNVASRRPIIMANPSFEFE